MTATTPDPADVELVARVLATARADGDLFDEFTGDHWDGQREVYRDDARAILTALAGSGRLLPPDADTRTEPDLWQYGRPDLDAGPDGITVFVGTPRIITPRMVRRPMRAVGPWGPVPTPDAGESS